MKIRKLSSETVGHFGCSWAWCRTITLPGNGTWTITTKKDTNPSVQHSVSVLQRICFIWPITFLKCECPCYQRDTVCASPESPKQGGFFFLSTVYDNLQSLEEHMRHVRTKKIPLLISYPTTTQALFWTFKFVFRWLQNYVLACFHSSRLRSDLAE